MTDPDKISVKDFHYYLPEDKIAKYPLNKRSKSKLLIYNRGNLKKDLFANITRYLLSDHLLVFNNARVVHARLLFRKPTGALIEIFCLEPVDPPDYTSAFRNNKSVIWKCMVGNLKKWKTGRLTLDLDIKNKPVKLEAQQVNREQDYVILEICWDNQQVTFGEILEQSGKVPIPPYLKRESEEIDKHRYQTIYSKVKGSVAAPTAGLHFTDNIFEELDRKGVQRTELTLHIGVGTFRPVKTETASQHTMHVENFSVSIATLEKLINMAPRIIAVGTTSVRTMESLYWLGVKMHHGRYTDKQQISLGQWEYRDLPGDLGVIQSLKEIHQYLKNSGREYLNASTQIMIAPGYSFKLTSGMITNFHLPGSSLLMLIAAFVGEDWMRIYQSALKNDFRFLSYGDSSLLFPRQ
jgi:S-adenosylmethionine:tRNA ribosyltransferase-isomerase